MGTDVTNRAVFIFLLCGIFATVSLPRASGQSAFFQIPSPWVWVCNTTTQQCIKTASSTTTSGTSHAVCKLTCYDSSVIWPKPTGTTTLSKNLISFVADNVQFSKIAAPDQTVTTLLRDASDIFLGTVRQMEWNGLNASSKTCPATSKTCRTVPYRAAGHRLNIEVTVSNSDNQLTVTTDESYSLDIESQDTNSTAYIVAPTYFGARHAMETLTQLMIWDEVSNALVAIESASIKDRPVFPHRGLSIDTSRTYFEMPILKRIVDAMSYNKLNTFHWHITDSNSFPFVSTRQPLMAIHGAYSARKVYQPKDIQDFVQYARIRGVKVIPELDGPSHTGAGWDWGPQYDMGELVLCFDKQPWDLYCNQPPCGILNPINENVYKVMENIYKDMSEVFLSDLFHLGGDEISFRCWNETESITKWMANQGWGRGEEDFLKLWSHFQNNSLKALDNAYGKQQDVLFWTSKLTYKGHAPQYLDKARYILQLWEEKDANDTKFVIEQGYRLIMSNYDPLYLDCGYGSWVGDGQNNWCSPYKGWKAIYDNSPRKLVENFGLPYNPKQFLGGEAALWAEQTQGISIESKLWPRSSALAERLWSDPPTGWLAAQPRFLFQRERMVDRGILADLTQPQWCYENDASCLMYSA